MKLAAAEAKGGQEDREILYIRLYGYTKLSTYVIQLTVSYHFISYVLFYFIFISIFD